TVLSVTINGVRPGQIYYVRVTGADSSVYSVGAYALGFSFASYPIHFAPPDTRVWNGFPLRGSGSDFESTSPDTELDEESRDSFRPVVQGDSNTTSQLAADMSQAAVLFQISIRQSNGTIEQNPSVSPGWTAMPLFFPARRFFELFVTVPVPADRQ